MAKDDVIELEGTVVEALPNTSADDLSTYASDIQAARVAYTNLATTERLDKIGASLVDKLESVERELAARGEDATSEPAVNLQKVRNLLNTAINAPTGTDTEDGSSTTVFTFDTSLASDVSTITRERTGNTDKYTFAGGRFDGMVYTVSYALDSSTTPASYKAVRTTIKQGSDTYRATYGKGKDAAAYIAAVESLTLARTVAGDTIGLEAYNALSDVAKGAYEEDSANVYELVTITADAYAALSDEEIANLAGEAAGEIPYEEIGLENILTGDVYKTQYHGGPYQHWMNEPHAPVYYNGLYHLFFQSNSVGTYWRNICWGHLVSEDTVHWRQIQDAIVPTEKTANSSSLTRDEALLFDMIARRLIAAHYPSYEYDAAKVITRVGEHRFKSTGAMPVVEGWRALYRGDKTEEKMKGCKFHLEDGQMAGEHPGEKFPKVVTEAFQVIECTWMRELDHAEDCKPGELDGYEGPYHDFNGITSKFGATFILRVDKILMKEKYYNAIINGVKAKDFPHIPVDYGYRDSKNPYDNWIAGGFTAFFWFMCRFYSESRFRLNLSCHLNGTGFMVSDAAVREVGWDTHTLTEDLEFTALCALKGIKVGWMANARIYDEQTTSFATSCIQRRRWTSGSLQCLKRYVPKLMKVHSLMSLDMIVLFTGNLLCLIGLVPAVGTVLGLLPFFISHPWRILALVLLGAVYYLAFCAVGAVLYKWEGRLNRRAIPGIMCLPIFMASWMPCSIWACLTPPPKWKAIRHERGVAEPDIEE